EKILEAVGSPALLDCKLHVRAPAVGGALDTVHDAREDRLVRLALPGVAPPQIKIAWPVMPPASSESRKAVSAATSSGRISRPIGGTTGATPARAGSASIAVAVGAGAGKVAGLARRI